MKRKTLRNALAAGILAAMSGYAVQASALPTFSFTEWGGFEFGDVGSPVEYVNLIPNNPALTPPQVIYDTMRWPQGDAIQSSLVVSTVTGPAALPINTWTTVSTLTHNNFVIDTVVEWDNQDVWGRLIISDLVGVVKDDNEATTFAFDETLNTTIAECDPTPNPTGSPKACDDKFSFTTGLGDLFLTSLEDSSTWKVEFQLVPGPADPGPLAVVGCGGDCVYTAEEGSSKIYVQARIVPYQVPEPAMLSLVGFGLLGLGFGVRRRQGHKAA